MEQVVLLSNIIRYCGNNDRSNGMSMTFPAHVNPIVGLNSSMCVPGGYGLLMSTVSSQCRDTKRPPLYSIVG
jgi:hypothetical protein